MQGHIWSIRPLHHSQLMNFSAHSHNGWIQFRLNGFSILPAVKQFSKYLTYYRLTKKILLDNTLMDGYMHTKSHTCTWSSGRSSSWSAPSLLDSRFNAISAMSLSRMLCAISSVYKYKWMRWYREQVIEKDILISRYSRKLHVHETLAPFHNKWHQFRTAYWFLL